MPGHPQRHVWLDLKLKGLNYRQIALQAGVSYQAVHQVLAPPKEVRAFVAHRADYACQVCGVPLGKRGNVHHPSNDDTVHWDEIERLTYLCDHDHWAAHGYAFPEKEETKGILIRLPARTKAQLDAVVEAQQTSIQQWVAAVIELALTTNVSPVGRRRSAPRKEVVNMS